MPGKINDGDPTANVGARKKKVTKRQLKKRACTMYSPLVEEAVAGGCSTSAVDLHSEINC
jgi:hypothetical protein